MAKKMTAKQRAAERARIAAAMASAAPTPSFDPARFRMGEEKDRPTPESTIDYDAIAELAALEGEAALTQSGLYEQLAREAEANAGIQEQLSEAERLKKAAEDAAAAAAAEKAAADKAAAEKAARDKAAADAAAAEAAAAAKAAADKAAAEKAALEAALAAAKTQAEKDKIAAAAAAAAEAARVAAEKAAAAKAAQDAIAAAIAAGKNINVAGNVVTTVPGPYGTVAGSANQADILAKQYAEQQAAREKEQQMQRQSIISIMSDRLSRYNLQSLVPTIKRLAQEGATEATITLALQETEEYKRRFKANEDRIKKNLQVLNPAEYLNLEDGYRQILRSYGLNQFDTDDYVNQFIANDVSAAELSNRVVTAVQRVRNADPAIAKTLKEFYGIGDTDLVAYVLDPNQQFPKIQTQVSAAEIGAAARLQGIQPGVAVSEQLARQGITQAEAQRGYATIANILPGAEKLSQIYGTTLEGYGLAEAEQEIFNSLASAQRKRQRLTEREQGAFTGTSGLGRGSLATQIGGNI